MGKITCKLFYSAEQDNVVCCVVAMGEIGECRAIRAIVEKPSGRLRKKLGMEGLDVASIRHELKERFSVPYYYNG